MVKHPPEKIVVGGVIEQIEALLFAIVNLHIKITLAYERRGRPTRNSGKLTSGAPGIAKLAMNIPRALF